MLPWVCWVLSAGAIEVNVEGPIALPFAVVDLMSAVAPTLDLDRAMTIVGPPNAVPDSSLDMAAASVATSDGALHPLLHYLFELSQRFNDTR